MSLSDLIHGPQYSLAQADKEAQLLVELKRLTEHHRLRSAAYSRLLDMFNPTDIRAMTDVPCLPVGLFKTHLLSSVPDAEIFKTMTSSGTTGQQVSRVVLDRETAQRQSEALAAIMTHTLGPARLPMRYHQASISPSAPCR